MIDENLVVLDGPLWLHIMAKEIAVCGIGGLILHCGK